MGGLDVRTGDERFLTRHRHARHRASSSGSSGKDGIHQVTMLDVILLRVRDSIADVFRDAARRHLSDDEAPAGSRNPS